MKNVWLSLTIALMLLLQACGSKSETANTKEEKVVTAATSAIHLTRGEFIAKVIDFTKGSEDVKYLGDKPCIVDFYASWCGPCKIVAPIMEELAKEYEGRIYIYKVSTENEKQLATELGIQSIPTFIFFPMGGKPFSSQGIAKSPEETKKMFKEIIEKELLKIR
ncbi:MAG: thiol reductase thioredoxin [Bacteroidales bacterium]|nr:MAG: thiol reductase thioredoxin [Bacteroidales bacterium]